MRSIQPSIQNSELSDFKEIHNSQLNDSLSKHMWTFSRSGRFSKDSVYCDKIYNLNSQQDMRATALGFGKKSDFTKDLAKAPPPTRYESASLFDENKIKSKGYSLAVGRDVIHCQIQLTSPRGHIELEPLKVPGPGAYESDHEKGVLYTMRMKLKALDKGQPVDYQAETVEAQNVNPGPGSYNNPEATSPRGNYYLSKFKDSGARFFNPSSSTRFSKVRNFLVNSESRVPGPGSYINLQNDLSSHGKYVLSKDKGHGRRSFEHEARRSFVDEFCKLHRTPGPGSYRSPSDFGHYDKK